MHPKIHTLFLQNNASSGTFFGLIFYFLGFSLFFTFKKKKQQQCQKKLKLYINDPFIFLSIPKKISY